MARKPANVSWIGFTEEQGGMLDFLDHLGNNGWDRNSQTEEIMPKFIVEIDTEIGLSRAKEAMRSIGYSEYSLHMLDRWLSKAKTGRFGR